MTRISAPAGLALSEATKWVRRRTVLMYRGRAPGCLALPKSIADTSFLWTTEVGMLVYGARGRIFGWVALSLTLLMACGGPAPAETNHPATVAPAGSTTPTGSSSPTESAVPLDSPGSSPAASQSAIFDTPEPIDVAVALETDKMVEALIPVDGGSISATGSDGTVYTLDVPSDALLNDTTIGLTPVLTLTGMPFGGTQTYAVQLSPEGLHLENFAILTITPTTEIPVEQQTFFGYLGNGKDLIFAPPVADSSELKINVLHFSGDGVTNGSPAKVDPLRERLGGDAERRFQSWAAEQLGNERQRQLLNGDEDGNPEFTEEFAEADRQFYEQVVKPRVAAAGESCEAGHLALSTVIGFERTHGLLGSRDVFYDKYPGLVDKVARTCVLEEFTACVQYHRIFLMLPIYEGMVRQQSLFPLYSAGTLAEARDLTIKCLTFRLELESTGKMNFAGMARAESTVTMKLQLRYDPDSGLISGFGEYVNTDYSVSAMDCSVRSTPGGGIFAVIGLLYELENGSPDSDGNYPGAHVSDLTLAYSPDNSTEKATLTCPNGPGMPPSILPFDIPVWSGAFFDAHANELDEAGLKATDWEMHSDELFAEKEWDLVGAADPSSSESGNFKLYHVPGG